METVNNLNGIPNFGHGMPEDGVVIAGVTDVPQTPMEDEVPTEGHVDMPEVEDEPTETTEEVAE